MFALLKVETMENYEIFLRSGESRGVHAKEIGK